DEREGGGQAIEEVDLDRHALLPQQVVGRVEPGGPGAHDRDPQRALRRAGDRLGRHQEARGVFTSSSLRSWNCSVSTSPWYWSRWALTTSPMEMMPTRRPPSSTGR